MHPDRVSAKKITAERHESTKGVLARSFPRPYGFRPKNHGKDFSAGRWGAER